MNACFDIHFEKVKQIRKKKKRNFLKFGGINRVSESISRRNYIVPSISLPSPFSISVFKSPQIQTEKTQLNSERERERNFHFLSQLLPLQWLSCLSSVDCSSSLFSFSRLIKSKSSCFFLLFRSGFFVRPLCVSSRTPFYHLFIMIWSSFIFNSLCGLLLKCREGERRGLYSVLFLR